jgi:colicin import membrane protein
MSPFPNTPQVFFSEPRLSKTIVYSLFIHLFLFGVIIGVPPSQRNIDFVPFYTVDLVNLPPTMLPPVSAKTEAESSKSLALPQGVKEGKKSSVKEKDYSKELDATIAKIKEKVARERARVGEEEIAKTISQIREKIALKGEGGFTGTKGSPSSVSAQTPSASTPGSYQMNLYLTVIWEKIHSAWTLTPNLVQGKKDLESIIAIKIRKNGEIVDMNFEKRSGNHYLDESAMRAIKKANPLPPLPDVFREEYLEIGIRFLPSDLG